MSARRLVDPWTASLAERPLVGCAAGGVCDAASDQLPDAIRATAAIARRCTFDLGELSYQYPDERVVDGLTAQQALEQITEAAVERRFPDGVPPQYRTQIDHELRLIAELAYAPYFLTVNSIVAESWRRGILCQGRGSAANSCVCFMLGITSIDPIKHELLFERFISGERREPRDPG